MPASNNSVYTDSLNGNSIRLLRFSRKENGTFRGQLSTFRLAEAPKFFTASYTWGTKARSNTTIELPSGSLPVLRSLQPFLRMVAKHSDFSDKDWWWIDSLCINLAHKQEREQQVRLMGSIYRKAKRAIVWLGEEEEESSDCAGAIEFLHYLASLQPSFTIDSKSTRQSLREQQYKCEWAAVSNLLVRPWWKRVWTLQELILPKEAKLYCGSDSISRGKFKSAMYSIFLASTRGNNMDEDLVPRAAFDAAFNRRRIHQWFTLPQPRGLNLVAIMAYLGNHSATDPRDRIYSVLGLVTARDRRLVGDPEYTPSVAAIFAKLVRSFWAEHQSLDIICFTHIFSRYSRAEDMGLSDAVPSWVPDWRASHDFASPVPLMASQSASEHIGNFRPLHATKWNTKYDAPGQKLKTKANVRFHDNLKEMWCDGIVVDVVANLGGLDWCDTRCRGFVCARDGHGPRFPVSSSSLPDQYETGLEILEAIARSLSLDRQDKYLRFSAPRHYISDFLALCHACIERHAVDNLFSAWFHQHKQLYVGSNTFGQVVDEVLSYPNQNGFASLPRPTISTPSVAYPPCPSSADAAESDEQDTFLTRFQDTVQKKSRRLMITEDGYVGMAPCRAQPGDVVAVLFGCSIPLILRPVGAREAWQVVGEAYLHEWMQGETAKSVRRGDAQVGKFLLV